jgi:putative copper export protein
VLQEAESDRMTLPLGLLQVFLKALELLGMASAVGGVIFCIAVLRPLDCLALRNTQGMKISLFLIVCGSALLAFALGVGLLIEPWALADEMGNWPLDQFLNTQFAHAVLLLTGLSLLLMTSALWLGKRPDSQSRWLVMTVAMVLLTASGARLSHAAGHLDHALPLMATTVIHQFGASAWGGGLLHLTVLRLSMRSSSREGGCLWPAVVARFSLLAMVSIGVLLMASLYLSYHYVGAWKGLISTPYGNIILTKATLLAGALCLGALNFLSVRSWIGKGNSEGISQKAPVFIKAEMWITLILFSLAAALTYQPPAVDALNVWKAPIEEPKNVNRSLPN